MSSWKLPSSHRLKSRKQIQYLFQDGHSIKQYPVRLVFNILEQTSQDEIIPYKVGFSCSKKKFKRAVDRNRLKRLMRESFRLQQNEMFFSDGKECHLMFIYMGHELSEYQTIYKATSQLVKQFNQLNS